MTFEAYLDGALWFRQQNWEPKAAIRQISDGRLIKGEWCEIFAKSKRYESIGSQWRCLYEVTVNIPPNARLDYSVVSTIYTENPLGIVDDPYTFYYQSLGIGPRNNVLVRIVGYDRYDDDDYTYEGTRFRLVVRLYFSRVSQLILRDPAQGNVILRASAYYGRTIQRDV